VTKRNETKFRLLYCFAKHAKFRETGDEFRIVSCFAKLKKHAKLETLQVIIRKKANQRYAYSMAQSVLCLSVKSPRNQHAHILASVLIS
jgi:hypothetical protein